MLYYFCPVDYISIHALLAESDLHTGSSWAAWFPFLSTLSLRRATYTAIVLVPPIPISIHALLAESDGPMERGQVYYINFYPRSPCGERLMEHLDCKHTKGFLSTLSLRRATKNQVALQYSRKISIHALLAESDLFEVFSYLLL